MDILEQLGSWATLAITAAILIIVALVIRFGLTRKSSRFYRGVGWTLFWLVGLLAVISAAPLEDTVQSQLLNLVAVVLSAAIALGSTTLVSQALAGVMLKFSGTFRTGDYIKVDNIEGRVIDHALFSTEIQTRCISGEKPMCVGRPSPSQSSSTTASRG